MSGIKIAGGSITRRENGTFLAYMLDPSGTRIRRVFKTYQAAEAFLLEQRSIGVLPPLTPSQYADAQAALAILPADRTLVEAARSMKAAESDRTKIRASLSEALAEFLAERSVSASRSTTSKYRLHCGRLVSEVGASIPVSSVTRDDIERLVSGRSPAYRNATIRNLSPFLSWCVMRGYCTANAATSVPRSRIPSRSPGVLSVEEAEALMRACVATGDADLIAFHAVGLFAGVRPDEIRRLRKEDFRNGHIILSAAITKTSDARTVPIRPNLASWLKKWPPENLSAITTTRAYKFRRRVGIRWSPDCMRHSFATYAFEECRNAASVASEMGHVGTDVFYRHYRAFAAPGDGARFFSIGP